MSTILISGAGRGLGLELARQYAADGWRVIGTVRDAAARSRLEKLGAQAHIADVTKREQLAALARQAKGAALDVLFCNAGISGKRGMTLGRFDYESWEEVLRVNVLGAAALVEELLDNVAASERKVIAGLKAQDSGRFFSYDGSSIPW